MPQGVPVTFKKCTLSFLTSALAAFSLQRAPLRYLYCWWQSFSSFCGLSPNFAKNGVCVSHFLCCFQMIFQDGRREIPILSCYIQLTNLMPVEFVKKKKKFDVCSYVKYFMCIHICIVYLLHCLYLELRFKIYSPSFIKY